MTVLAQYDRASEWPDPDPRLLAGGVRPAPPFPLPQLGALAEPLGDIAATKGAPIDYLALPLFSAAAGVIGAARSPQVRPGWKEHTALWALNVGAPSSNKTPPLMVIQSAVVSIEQEAAPDFDVQLARFREREQVARLEEDVWKERARKALKADGIAPEKPADATIPEEPHRPRVFVADATPEAVSKLFSRNERGLLLIRDEAAAWLGGFGKYGGDGDAAFYLGTFNGVATPVDRVKDNGSTPPVRGLLSICGGIQPERLNEMLIATRADDGLLGRFLMAWPDPVPRVYRVRAADETLPLRLLRRLRGLEMVRDDEGQLAPQLVPLSSAAEKIFESWYEDPQNADQHGRGMLASFRGKGAGMVCRLALVLDLLRWAHAGGKEPQEISPRALSDALVLWESYFLPMAERIYGDAALSAAERTAISLLSEIRQRRCTAFNLRVARRDWSVPKMSTSEPAAAAAAVLVDADCIELAPRAEGQRGRPPAEYIVNPKVLERTR